MKSLRTNKIFSSIQIMSASLKNILYFKENFMATSSKQPQTLGHVERPSPPKTLPTYKLAILYTKY
jgi:hypothetical protein